MQKGLFLLILSALIGLLTGCSTPPPAPAPEPIPEPVIPVEMPEPVVQSTLLTEMQDLAGEITRSGGLAALGTAESRSLELALNMAKRNGRLELARILNDRIEALAKAFSDETEIPYDSLLLSGFNNTEKMLTGQIAGSIAQALKYESSGDKSTAYAIMALDPKAIADQLAQEKDLYARLQPTKAFGALDKEIKSFAAFKSAQK